jgi:hypothetical protein
MQCPVPDICCYNPDNNMPPDKCGKAGQCGMGYTEVSCSSPAYCPGGYCCAQFTVGGTPPNTYRRYTNISCQAQCNMPQQEIIVCDPNSANPCPFGGQCVPSTLLGTPYHVCG